MAPNEPNVELTNPAVEVSEPDAQQSLPDEKKPVAPSSEMQDDSMTAAVAVAAPPSHHISTTLDISKVIVPDVPEGGTQSNMNDSAASKRAAQRLERANARANSIQQAPPQDATPPVFSPRSAAVAKKKEEDDLFIVDQPIFTDRAMPSKKLAPARPPSDAPIFTPRSTSVGTASMKAFVQPGQGAVVGEDELVFTHRGGAEPVAAPADEPAWTNFPTTNQVELPSAGEMPVFLMTTLEEHEGEEDDDSDSLDGAEGREMDGPATADGGIVASDHAAAPAAAISDEHEDANQKAAVISEEVLANEPQLSFDEDATKAAIDRPKGGGNRKKMGKAKKLPSKASKKSSGSPAPATTPDKPPVEKPPAKSSPQKQGKGKSKKGGGKKRAQSSSCTVVMEVHSEDGKVVSKQAIEWSANELKESFEKLVLPLLLSEHSVASLGAAHLSVNGVSVEGSAVASTILPTNKTKDRLVIRLDNSGASGGADALRLGVGEACFVVELFAPDGQLVAASGAVFNKSWLNRPLVKVAVEPALLNAGIARGGDGAMKHVEKIKIEGHVIDGKAKAISFVEASGGNGVRVIASLRASSVPTFLELDIADSENEIVSQMSTVLNAATLDKPLGQVLVKPALESANIVPKVPVEHVQVWIVHSDGRMMLGLDQLMKTKFSKVLATWRADAPARASYGSSEAKAIRLLLTLPAGAAPVERLPMNVNVTLSHNGHGLACMNAELTLKSLEKPLEIALIKPAIASHLRTADLDSFTASQFRLLLAKEGLENVTATLNGMDVNIDASLRALASVTAAVAEEPQLVICLPNPPSTLEGAPSKVPFHVTISVNPVGNTLATPETVELDTWLENEHLNAEINQSLVAPALALYSLDASAFVDSIAIDGAISDGKFSGLQISHAYGRAIKLTIHGSQLPGGVSHLAEFLSESELARRTMPLHESEHSTSTIGIGAQLSKARGAVASGVSNALRRLSLTGTGSSDAPRKAPTPPSASKSTKGSLFVVHMDGHFSDGDMWAETFDTRLNSAWLKKPLAVALVEPALQAYYASEHYARRQPYGEEKVKFSGITVSVNGRELDEAALTSMTPSYFVYSDETASEIRISFQASF